MDNSSSDSRGGLGVAMSVIMVLALSAVSYFAATGFNTSLSKALDEKAQVMTQHLAAVLGDPLSMGEYDHMSQILESAQKGDPDLKYAIVTSKDGIAIASTDATLKAKKLNRDDFETSALSVTDFTTRSNPNDKQVVETVSPIRTGGGTGGILRCGYSTARLEAAQAAMVSQIMTTGGIVLFVSIIVTLSLLNMGKTKATPPTS